MVFQIKSQAFLCLLLLVFLACCLSSSHAYKFYVGGNDGWVKNPKESYNHWAERNRFLISDTLYFKYKKGSDSVLVVEEEDFYSCNTKNQLKKMDSGDSEFKLDRSGPFFFISGDRDHCQKGQKLIVIVLHVRTPPPPPPPPSTIPAPSPKPTPPSQSSPTYPPKVSPAPATPPSHHPPAPSPKSPPPTSRAPVPSTSTPTPSSHGGNPPAVPPPQSANIPSASASASGTPADGKSPPSPRKSKAASLATPSFMVVGVCIVLGSLFSGI